MGIEHVVRVSDLRHVTRQTAEEVVQYLYEIRDHFIIEGMERRSRDVDEFIDRFKQETGVYE